MCTTKSSRKKVVENVLIDSDITLAQLCEFTRQLKAKMITGPHMEKVLKHFEPERCFSPNSEGVTTTQTRNLFRLIDEGKIKKSIFQDILNKKKNFGVEKK